MVALSCCFKEEEDQAAALWATPPSQNCLEVLSHPSSFNLPTLDQPSTMPRVQILRKCELLPPCQQAILIFLCHGAGENDSSRILSGALLIHKETC